MFTGGTGLSSVKDPTRPVINAAEAYQVELDEHGTISFNSNVGANTASRTLALLTSSGGAFKVGLTGRDACVCILRAGTHAMGGGNGDGLGAATHTPAGDADEFEDIDDEEEEESHGKGAHANTGKLQPAACAADATPGGQIIVLRKEKAQMRPTPLEFGDVVILDGSSFLKGLCRSYKVVDSGHASAHGPARSIEQHTASTMQPAHVGNGAAYVSTNYPHSHPAGSRSDGHDASANDADNNDSEDDADGVEAMSPSFADDGEAMQVQPSSAISAPETPADQANDEDPEAPLFDAAERCLHAAKRPLLIHKILRLVNKHLSEMSEINIDLDELRGLILGRTDVFACDGEGAGMSVWLKGSAAIVDQESDSEPDDGDDADFSDDASDEEGTVSRDDAVDDEPCDPAELFEMVRDELRKGTDTSLLDFRHKDHDNAMHDAGIPASQYTLFDSFCDVAFDHKLWYRKGAPGQGDAGFNMLATEVLNANFPGKADLAMHSSDPVLKCSACGKCRVVDPGRTFYENKGQEADKAWTCSSDGSPVANLEEPCTQTQPKSAVEALQPYQKTVKCLVHPLSPVQRMLVAHRTGAGKTRTMVGILDNFYHDDRPKIVVLPTRGVVENFWKELLNTPNKYLEYAQKQYALDQETPHALLSDKVSTDDKIEYMRRCFRLRRFYSARARKDNKRAQWLHARGKENKGEGRLANGLILPAAPLLILSYARAGGRTVESFALPEFKFPGPLCDWPDNPYDGTIVLMDEAHNLVDTLMKQAFRKYESKIKNLRSWLSKAKNAVVVGLTATPVSGSDCDNIASGICQGRNKLLSVIKGEANAGKSAEGFVSCFTASPRSLFPRVVPGGVPTVAIPVIVNVELGLPMRRKYLARVRTFKRQEDRGSTSAENVVCMPYCNTSTFFSRTRSEIEAAGGCVQDAFTSDKAAKLNRLAGDILLDWQESCSQAPGGESNCKLLVMIDRRCGWQALVRLLRERARNDTQGPHQSLYNLREDQVCSYPPLPDDARSISAADLLERFNRPANSDGSDIAVMIADSKEASEGVSFKAVRRLYLANVPLSWLEYQQLVGRAVRAFSHSHLELADQEVAVKMYVGTMSPIHQSCFNCNSSCTDTDEDERPVAWHCSMCDKWMCSLQCRKVHAARCDANAKSIMRWQRNNLRGRDTVEEKSLQELRRVLEDTAPLRKLELVAVDRAVLLANNEILDSSKVATRIFREARLRCLKKRQEKKAEDMQLADLQEHAKALESILASHQDAHAGTHGATNGSCWCCPSAGPVFRCSCQPQFVEINDDLSLNQGLCKDCFASVLRSATDSAQCLRSNRLPCFNNPSSDGIHPTCPDVKRLRLRQALHAIRPTLEEDGAYEEIEQRMTAFSTAELQRVESEKLELEAKVKELTVFNSFGPPAYWDGDTPKDIGFFRGQRPYELHDEGPDFVKEVQRLVDRYDAFGLLSLSC